MKKISQVFRTEAACEPSGRARAFVKSTRLEGGAGQGWEGEPLET